MTRIAAVGDIHVGTDSVGRVAEGFRHVSERADALLLAGDLTRCGEPSEMRLVVGELAGVTIPVVAVLGNHDHHADRPQECARILTDAGVTVLDGGATTIEVGGCTLGIAGTKGFGGGFAGACASAFGERAMKAFVEETQGEACRLQESLEGLQTDHKVALLHFSPVEETLHGERLEIYPFLGSYLLAEAIDVGGADLALHGHAHGGSERGMTPGGTRVRNVAQPVIGHAYRVFDLGAGGSADDAAGANGDAEAVPAAGR